MALISCPECKTQVSDKANSCPSCGCPIAEQSHSVVPQPTGDSTKPPAKSRWVFIVLGLLFGLFGFHDFYAGYYKSGWAKIALTALGLAYFPFLAVSAIWALVGVIFCDEDAYDQKLI